LRNGTIDEALVVWVRGVYFVDQYTMCSAENVEDFKKENGELNIYIP
jgi:hypothetical protein